MMNDFSIGIIGGTGGIGKWFADFFTEEGYTVHVAGRERGLPAAELASLCRVIVVAVPIAATLSVIEKVGPHLPADSLLMDLTSLKEESVRAMLAATSASVVGCHPLFGPDVPSMQDNNIILCPARGEHWLSFLKKLFAGCGARVTIASPEEHDRMMSLVQGLNHFNTLLMELVLRDSGMAQTDIEAFSTPIFRTKRALGAKLFGANADLYAAIITKNPHIIKVIERYEQNLSLIKGLIAERNTRGLAELLKR